MALMKPSWAMVRACVLMVLMLIAGITPAIAQTFPGGWVERSGSAIRPRYSTSQLQSFIPPARGPFTFPAPYNTRGVRITDASDCGGTDCVAYVGYSYWRNTNAHQGSDEMLIFLGLGSSGGPTLFRYNKTTDAITRVGPVFPAGSRFNSHSGNTWYFSASLPTKLYLPDGPRMLRYDVIAKTFETVYDITAQFGSNRNIYQMHSSNDDRVHSATLQVTNTGEYLGCLVYSQITGQFRFYPKVGVYDECNLDKSGRWIISLEDVGIGSGDLANRIFDNQTGRETRINGPSGTLGHLDTGYGYAVGADNYNPLPNATIMSDFEPTIVQGPVIHSNISWDIAMLNHVSHTNAKPNVPAAQQYACGSTAISNNAVQSEITCVRIDGSRDALVVAPVMTDLAAPGGGGGTYEKSPKGNLDITGKYFIWTTNLGGNRLDAFIVKVPAQLLVPQGDVTPPATPINLRIN